MTAQGYVKVSVDRADPLEASCAHENGQAFEHRIVMAKKLQRPLRKGETVHHKNGRRADNRPENLELRVTAHGSGALVHEVVDEAKRELARELRARRDRRLKRQLRRHPLGPLELGDVLRDEFDFTSADLRAALRQPRPTGGKGVS